MQKFKNALVSVSDKSGLVEFIKTLAHQGTRIVSTGGTAKVLREADIEVVDVSEQTGFPEVMGGRVKTLHPKIHMALLARSSVPEDIKVLEESGLLAFDLVVGNLYPFEKSIGLSEAEKVELIDIGGPSFLRAAAKSFDRITTVVDPKDYSLILESETMTQELRKKLAAKVFFHTGSYDSMIASELGGTTFEAHHSIGGEKMETLRYGENPHQEAAWFKLRGAKEGLHQAEIIQGKALSYNNLLDLDAAVSTLAELGELCSAVAVKHLNPCGVGQGKSVEESVARALAADPVSVFGGIVAVNNPINEAAATALSGLFLECIVAPGFSKPALEIFAKKKNLRILKWAELAKKPFHLKVRSVIGGYLVQTQDKVEGWSDHWEVIGETPNDKIKQDLTLAWQICAHLKSNAIALVSNGQSVGLGMGQVNRVDAVEQAIIRMKNHHGDCEEPVLASDAFFPFADSIEKAAAAGIKWVIQPGGSIKDGDVKDMAKKLGVNLVLTGKRHFQH